MKYGEQFEKESVPQWSLHNIDYNSLKHHIKVHTTKDQATAIAIPGHQDAALRKFEDELYSELCRQHDRVDLFVTSKADEIARRLNHLSNQVHRLILRCATSGQDRMPLKRRQRFAKYEQELIRCGDDIRALQRFVSAQIVAFRKILKKYRKWTGSSTLGSRFRDNILSHPKSFTRRDFSQLQSRYDDLLRTLQAAIPADLSNNVPPAVESRRSRLPSIQVSPSETIVASGSQQSTARYWNEYDHGSEAGDLTQNADGEYAIYIDPDADVSFPGMKALGTFFTTPVQKFNLWISRRQQDTNDDERGPLLPTHSSASAYGSTTQSLEPSCSSSSPSGGPVASSAVVADTDAEDGYRPSSWHSRRGSYGGYASSEEGNYFPTGYRAHYAALPSISEQRMMQYRERVLFWGTWGCYGVSFVLMGIAAVLVVAGRNRMRLEVDAGVTLGIMTSLGLACAALCMACSRQKKSPWLTKAAVWATFAVACVANGVLLVLVMGRAKL
ncbi:Xenotropic and polytropic retrovirus receptor 1 [Madurella mycetomatis]|uniref:Xenotropic and polytropic retrovirus receptor 1 n=1 Tax=Madurella mycetomatis TaxID=100816 RepID=A0A175WEA7_9PEZI|nr:Xenotropic and polytropic retrovirus receptor 1 [Madurella mycetomatis]